MKIDVDDRLEGLISGIYSGWKIGKKPEELLDPVNVEVLKGAMLRSVRTIEPAFDRLEITVRPHASLHIVKLEGGRWEQGFTVNLATGACTRHHHY